MKRTDRLVYVRQKVIFVIYARCYRSKIINNCVLIIRATHLLCTHWWGSKPLICFSYLHNVKKCILRGGQILSIDAFVIN